jgi:4-amino-4-deoxy-L-arabinose transferase-like glycosyltransferase
VLRSLTVNVSREQAGSDEPLGLSPRILLILAILAVAVRVAFVVLEPASRVTGDENRWLGWALEPPGGFASEKVRFSPFRNHFIFDPPLYAYFIAVIHTAAGSLAAVKIGQALLGGVLTMAIARVGAAVFGVRAGLAAGLIAALYPELVWFSAHFWSETLFMTFLWWAFDRVLAVERAGTLSRALAAGLLWGLAILTRETALYFLVAAAFWIAWGRGAAGRRHAAVFIVTALVVVAPWTYRNWVVFKAFVPVSTAGGQNMFQGNAPIERDETYIIVDREQGRIEQYRFAMRMGLRAIWDRQPTWIVEKLWEQMPNFWEAESMAVIHVKRGADDRPTGYGPTRVATAWTVAAVMIFPYLFVLAAFVIGLRDLRWTKPTVLLILFLLYYLALHIVTHGFTRYRLPVMPVLFLVAAWGLCAGAAERRSSRGRRAAVVTIALVLAACVIPSLRKTASHPAFGGSGAITEAPADEGAPAP